MGEQIVGQAKIEPFEGHQKNCEEIDETECV